MLLITEYLKTLFNEGLNITGMGAGWVRSEYELIDRTLHFKVYGDHVHCLSHDKHDARLEKMVARTPEMLRQFIRRHIENAKCAYPLYLKSKHGFVLVKSIDFNNYYCVSGGWWVNTKPVNGVLTIDSHPTKECFHLHGIELEAATKQEYIDANEGYVSKGVL